jgi:pimeloyl-ACP methyl ester carboxylesterase
MFLHGFHSDRGGQKALALEADAIAHGHGCVRFDMSGHGESEGAFTEGTIGRWREDCLAMLDGPARAAGDGRVVLVGSSMGGWLALLATLARPEVMAGLVLIAPAADFTERLMWPGMGAAGQATLLQTGVWHRHSSYETEPQPITRALIEEGRRWLLMDGPIPVGCPVRILHGDADDAVPWLHGAALVDLITGPDVRFTLIKGGDHRLSAPAELELMVATVREALQPNNGTRP